MRPIVKWAGGKTRLLGEILARMPARIGTYAEPFAGGAAVFFALASESASGRPSARRFERAVLADRNLDLVALYRATRDSVGDLIEALRGFRYDRDLFYEVRAQDPSAMSDVSRGARLLFLNRTCYNGLWRVNSKGIFNVPFGRYKNPKILDEKGLRSAALLLAQTELVHGDFSEVTGKLGSGDFVYLDPPYAPASITSDFTAYAREGFGPDDQQRLATELLRLRKKRVLALLSNADTPETRALYAGLSQDRVRVARSINSDPESRGEVSELLVSNWAPTSPRKRRSAMA